MIPTRVNEAAPVPPPAYHRAQARLSPALHMDALTLINTLHLLPLCRLAVRLAHHRCPPPLPCLAPLARPGRTAKSLCCSSRFCAHYDGFRIKTCTIGCVTGRPWPWRAACREGEMAV